MNVYKPFVLNTYVAGQSNNYQTYQVATFYKEWRNGASQYVGNLIYTGKTWCDENGHTTLNLTSILKDHVFTPYAEYNGNVQRWEVQGGQPLGTIEPIEKSGKFYNNELGIRFATVTTYEMETTKPTIYDALYNVPLNPYGNETGVIFYNSLATDIAPEIPHISTDDCYLGFTFAIDERFKNDTLILGNAAAFGNVITKTLNNEWGNYFVLSRLSELYSVLTQNLNGVYLTISGDTSHPIPFPERVAIINNCEYDYYLQWFTPWGSWQSQGLNGRHISIKNDLKKETITNLFNYERPINTESEFKYTLSRSCNKDLYKLLSTVIVSPFVWLYDVKNDIGKPVICTNSSMQTTIDTQVDTINLELQDAQKYNY